MERDRQIYLLAFSIRRLMKVVLESSDPDASGALKMADRTLYTIGCNRGALPEIAEEITKELGEDITS